MSRKHRDRSWPPLEAVEPLTVPVVDNHTHLPVPGVTEDGPGSQAPLDAAALVSRAAAAGVAGVITSACEAPAWEGSLQLAHQLAGVRVALAVHPNEAVLHAGVREVGPDGLEPPVRAHHAQPLDKVLSQLEALLRAHRDVVVAVGESGLDFFRSAERGRQVQHEAFRAHIALAKELDLPLQIHDRDAHAQCVELLLADGAPARTVFHCFSGGAELAQACAEQGWYVSVSGTITYPANTALRAALHLVPPELLLVETDAPYLPPAPWRGRPNGSYLLPATVRFLAAELGLAEEAMCALLNRNTTHVYGSW